MSMPFRSGFILLVCFICILSGIFSARADEVTLTNGDRISGKLISLSQKTVHFSTQHFGIVETDTEYLQQLETDKPMIVKLLSGECVIGRIGPGSGKTIVIQSSSIGDCVLSLTAIESIEPVSSSGKTGEEEENQLANLEKIRGKGSETLRPTDNADNKSANSRDQPGTIGQKPQDEEDIRRFFLRKSSILLNSGEMEAEVDFNYLGNQLPSTIVNLKFHQFQIPMSFRMGILNRMEGFLSLPFLYSRQEVTFADESTSQRSTGIGDLSFGINYQIFSETAFWPDIIESFKIRAPTGEKPGEQGLSEGSGHWAGSFGLQFIKTVDPVVLFWGMGYSHDLPARHFFNDGTYDVQPGDFIDYNFGFGFAVNHNISLSGQVLGEYQWETKTDGIEIPGSSSEPVSLRSALTYRISKGMFIEPSLTIGLNDNTPDFIIGIAATRRLGN